MANLNGISQTITQFRDDVIKRGGPQLGGFYDVTLYHWAQGPIKCYPAAVVVPGRQFVFYEHDLWGPNRRVPYKRSYGQCFMTFLVYQDFKERLYLENWMDSIIKNKSTSPTSSTATLGQQQEIDTLEGLESARGNVFTDTTFSNFGNTKDYIDYYSGLGFISINFLNSETKLINRSLGLYEAYPAQMQQIGLGSADTGPATFTVTFQFNNYQFA